MLREAIARKQTPKFIRRGSMYYEDVTPEDLQKLRDGLQILDRLEDREARQLYLYGLTNDPSVVEAAKEAISVYSDDEISEENIQLNEVAVVLPLSSDGLYYLLGSGYKLQRNDEFAYQGETGEGIRTIDFQWARLTKPQVTVATFSKMALSTFGGWVDKFLQQYGTKVPVKVNVQRTEPAEAPAAAPVPKQTSKHSSIGDIVETFLGG